MSDLLSGVAKKSLYRHAGKRNPIDPNIIWQRGMKTYRITRRVGVHVYVRWRGYGDHVRGLSVKYTVGEFIKKFKLA